MASKTIICLSETSETTTDGEECQHEEIVISNVSLECEVEERDNLSGENSICNTQSENPSETQEEEEKICEALETEEKSRENSITEEDLTENEETGAETDRKTEDEMEKDTEPKTDEESEEKREQESKTVKETKTDDEVERESKTDDEVDKECKTEDETEKDSPKFSEEESATDDETLMEKKAVGEQDEDTVTQGSVSKSEESQLQESFGENMDEDADSEAGGETDDTEVDVDERQRAEERCSRETSPTPCPPESPSPTESAAPMSVASTPDMRREGGDVMSSSSVDIKNELMLKLDGEINKDSLFQQRFFILASNYDEMIKMKDEYKAENERLRLENMQMKMENTRIYTEKLESKERENHKLHQTVDFLKRDLAETQSKLRTANDEYKGLCLSYEEKILRLVQNLSVAEETLADTVFKLREQEHVRSRQERENRRQCERLQKEKNDLMELALSGDRNNFYLS